MPPLPSTERTSYRGPKFGSQPALEGCAPAGVAPMLVPVAARPGAAEAALSGAMVALNGELLIRVASGSKGAGAGVAPCLSEGSLSLTASAGAAAADALDPPIDRGTSVAVGSGCSSRPHRPQRPAAGSFSKSHEGQVISRPG